jgi:CRISPR-associated protein Csd1
MVDQAVGLSSEITQKAHSALRWLIGRKQAYRSDSQVFIAWDTDGNDIPSPYADSRNLAGDEEIEKYEGDVGQAFAIRLKNKMRGYQGKIKQANKIIVMGLDSAVPGRMAIIFYRELKGSDFLTRIENWHTRFAWPQNY